MLKSLRKQLLKIKAIERRVTDYRKRLKLAKALHAGGNVHNLKPEKLDICDVLPVVADGWKYEDRLNGKVVGRGYVDSCNWGGLYDGGLHVQKVNL